MRDNEGSGFFYLKRLGDCTKYIHLGYWVVISEDALEVSFLIQYVKFKKNGEIYFEIII